MIDEGQLTELTAWLAEAGLAGESELALLIRFCERAVGAEQRVERREVQGMSKVGVGVAIQGYSCYCGPCSSGAAGRSAPLTGIH